MQVLKSSLKQLTVINEEFNKSTNSFSANDDSFLDSKSIPGVKTEEQILNEHQQVRILNALCKLISVVSEALPLDQFNSE